MLGAMVTLVPCPGCARHVRASESACPFCAEAIDAAPERVLAPAPNDRLFARAAITFAAAAATSLTACGKEPTDKPPPVPTNTTDPGPAPAYGPPPMMLEAAAPEPAPTTVVPTHAPAPAYGVPPINRNPTPKK